MKIAKYIGAGLGWALAGGPIGAIIGFAIGSMFDKAQDDKDEFLGQRISSGAADFSTSLLVLSAAVMKADGRVLKSELDYVKHFLVQQFGQRHAAQQVKMLQEILNQEIPLREVCLQIRQNMQHPLRLQLLHYLFGIARADGNVDSREVQVVAEIARHLGISEKDFLSIRAMFYKQQDSGAAYKILEIDSKATDDQVKKAYRKMAVKYHPDKVTQMGDEFKKAATEKFQAVQEAYETVKKERGMN